MAVSIDESGVIINEAGPKDNPRELEFYSHQVKHTIPGGNCVTGWSIAGDVPIGVSINGSGVISGVVNAMWQQTSCVPKKDSVYQELDGRDTNKNGRFGPQTYDFVFTTTVYWKEPDSNGSPCAVPGSTSESHTIILVKDHDADMMKFAKSYLDKVYPDREPYHCLIPIPPKTESECLAVGGEWLNNNCNVTGITTESACLSAGGEWVKNTLNIDGVVYDNYDDWIVAFTTGKPVYDGKVARLEDVLS